MVRVRAHLQATEQLQTLLCMGTVGVVTLLDEDLTHEILGPFQSEMSKGSRAWGKRTEKRKAFISNTARF